MEENCRLEILVQMILKHNLTVTVQKRSVKSKKKIKNRVRSLIVDQSTTRASGIGSTTLNDGLTFGNYPIWNKSSR